ncbi:MAG: M20 family metallopeptidase [Rhodothermia bacterium]|nr:M20 family metallopeptidase [Rhodothermia bacterium]
MEAEIAHRPVTLSSDYVEWAIALIERLAAIESPTSDGRAQRHIHTELGRELKKLGFEVALEGRTADYGGHMLAVPANAVLTQPYQLLVGHSDTVWPVGTLSTMPITMRDGKLFGPGVFDMKAGLVQAVLALKLLRDTSVETSVTPVVFVNSDEETGSRHSTTELEQLARRADRAMILEPALGRDGLLKTARKGGGRFRITVRGKPAHAGLSPEEGASAILELANVVRTLHGMNDPERGVSVNVGMIDGGNSPNVVAAEATAVVEIRIRDSRDGEALRDALQDLRPSVADTSIEIAGDFTRPPMMATPRNRRLWHAAERAAAELGLSLGETLAGGSSDGNTTSQYTATLDGLGAVGEGAHATHEQVYTDRIGERSILLAALIAHDAMEAEIDATNAQPCKAAPC